MSTSVVDQAELPPASSDSPTSSATDQKCFRVHILYTNLMESFGRLLLDLSGNLLLADSVALELAREEYTRLMVWGVQNRASSLPDIRGSLSGVLADQPGLEGLVASILEETHASLLRVLPEASTCNKASVELSDESDSESGESVSSDSGSEPLPEKPATYLKMVFQNVDELYRLQPLLRKPRLRDKYLHSTRTYDNLPGYQQDYQHVRQKLESWAKDRAAHSNKEEGDESDVSRQILNKPENDPSISMEDLLQRQRLEDDSSQIKNILCRRLAAANSKRRKQLRYWEAHPYREEADDDRRSILDAAKQTHPDLPVHNAPKSVNAPTTAHTFSTAPRSAIIPTTTKYGDNEVARTTYEPSLVGGSSRFKIRIPDVPLVANGQKILTCPFCYTTLEAEAMKNRDNWKRHVFRDLRPYLCTAESCSDPDRQYATRYDWIYHETQMHHRQWECPECSKVFQSKTAFNAHISHDHGQRWTETQLVILGDIRERAKNDTASSVCPFCSLDLLHHKLLEHMANHLEEISLFALPRLAHSDSDVKVDSNAANENRAAGSMGYDLKSWESVNETQQTNYTTEHDTPLPHVVDREQWAVIKPVLAMENIELSPRNEDGLSQPSPEHGSEYENRGKRVETIASKMKPMGQEPIAPEMTYFDADNLINLANALFNEGRYEEAEQKYRQAHELGVKTLGTRHPQTLRSLDCIASMLVEQGKYAEAEQLSRQVLELRKEALGAKHPDSLTSMNNLGCAIQSQGRYTEAEQTHRQVLKVREEVLGAKHPDTLTSMNNLGDAIQSQGRFEETEQLVQHTLELSKEVLGAKHPNTLSTMNNLGFAFQLLGRYEEAGQIYRQVLELREDLLGIRHPHTLNSMRSLGFLSETLGRYNEAEQTFRQVLDLQKEIQGAKHPDTLRTMSVLGHVIHEQGKYQEAEQIYRQVFELRENMLGLRHPGTLSAMDKLATILTKQGNYDEAEKINRRTLELEQEMPDKEHQIMLRAKDNLKNILKSQKRYDEVEELLSSKST
ncbi:hypothetical protein F5Y19DRAFT_443795 [Xylariaceae sp. FL1651]|nr:hypothetical protein F5Y19DRAFT_443795 [Xylariaceae sp. FL1651]